MINKSQFLLPLILILSALIRFLGIGDFSLSNDELSAVFRLDYDTLAELIQKGVIATDPHPAGVQVFLYYWTMLAGKSAVALRLPFVLASLTSLYFLFLTFRFWFTEQNALIIVAFFSLIEFSSIHGQLARPYAFGILFVSAFVWYWTQLLFEKASWKNVMLFSLFASLAAYTHYYAGLICALIGLVGLFKVVRSKNIGRYIMACLITIIFFTPHIPITLQQLSRGPLTSWIPPAEVDFALNHILALLNKSDILLVLIISFSALSLMYWREQKIDMKGKAFFSLLFFSLPILAGYIYSYFFGSALMDRVLYFSAPFFFAFTIGLMPPMLRYGQAVPVMGISLVVLLSTLLETEFLNRSYVENFKALTSEIEKVKKENSKTMAIYSNVNDQNYLNYYAEDQISHDLIAQNFDSAGQINTFMNSVQKDDETEMMLVYACKYQSLEAIEFARMKYPLVKNENHFFNSGFWHLSQGKGKRKILWQQEHTLVRGDSDLLDIHQNEEFINLYSNDIGKLKGQLVNTLVKFSDKAEKLVLVETIESAGQELILWRGHELKDYYFENKGEVFSTLRFNNSIPEGSQVKIYLWNPGQEEIQIDSILIRAFSDDYPQLN